MKRRWPQFGLPLLMRELGDQSSRARHYVLRTAFAGVLLLLGFLYLSDLSETSVSPGGFVTLGNGPALFDRVVYLEGLGIVLFLPAMTCGAIAGEKERNTLTVLLTTRLGPLTIVLEKLASRLVLIWTLLLLSLPLLAFAYALGGLGLDHMLNEMLWLVAISVLIATLSLMCSAWCGSTVSAFFMTYSLGIAFWVGGLAGFLRYYSPVYLRGGRLPSQSSMIAATLIPSAIFVWITVRCLVRRAAVTPRNF